jgi:hypothetical protein
LDCERVHPEFHNVVRTACLLFIPNPMSAAWVVMMFPFLNKELLKKMNFGWYENLVLIPE